MAVQTPDQLGRYAEVLTAAALMRTPDPRTSQPLFRPTHIGEKYPAVDFLVDLLGPNDSSRGFFFVQVKGTTSGKPSARRLTIDVSKDRFNTLVGITAPTYLIGVDLVAEGVYVVAANRPRRARVSSITKAFSLNEESVRVELYREVLGFWSAHQPLLLQTGFKDV